MPAADVLLNLVFAACDDDTKPHHVGMRRLLARAKTQIDFGSGSEKEKWWLDTAEKVIEHRMETGKF